MATAFNRLTHWGRRYQKTMSRAEFRQWLADRDFQLLRGTETPIWGNNVNPLSTAYDNMSDFHYYEDFTGPAGGISVEYNGGNVTVSSWMLNGGGPNGGPIRP